MHNEAQANAMLYSTVTEIRHEHQRIAAVLGPRNAKGRTAAQSAASARNFAKSPSSRRHAQQMLHKATNRFLFWGLALGALHTLAQYGS